MKLNINSMSGHSTKKKEQNNQENIYSKAISNNIKSKINKISYYRNNLSNENYSLWKTYYSNKNSNNSIIELNNIKEKERLKTKRPIHSASLIKKIKFNNCDNHPPKLLLNKKQYSVRRIHEMISIIEKKLNLLHSINRDNNNNIINIINNNNINYKDINYKNLVFKRSNKRKATFSISRTIYKFNNQSTLSLYKENINSNNIKNINIIKNNNNINNIKDETFRSTRNKSKKNKNDLIPYPFKRLQNKIRKYFSFSKKIKLSEEQIPFYIFSNKFLIKNEQFNEINNNLLNINKVHKYKHKIKYKYIYKQDNEKSKGSDEFIKKEDKSVNTENTFFKKNVNNLKNSRRKNKLLYKNKNTPQFNNELIASMTKSKDIKFFITTSINKNKKLLEEEHDNKRPILVYHKNY